MPECPAEFNTACYKIDGDGKQIAVTINNKTITLNKSGDNWVAPSTRKNIVNRAGEALGFYKPSTRDNVVTSEAGAEKAAEKAVDAANGEANGEAKANAEGDGTPGSGGARRKRRSNKRKPKKSAKKPKRSKKGKTRKQKK